MKASPIQQAFNAGELSPLLFARTDFSKYKHALALMRNWVPYIQGGMTRRPGTYHVATVKDAGSSATTYELIPFEFSVEQAYMLEFGNQYIRFFMDRAQIVDGGAPYEVTTPYLHMHTAELAYAQSADVLYLVHEKYQPRKLSRTGHTAWTLETIDFYDGPYLRVNSTATTLVSSAASGSVTLTASGTSGINRGAGFLASDVGRLVRVRDGTDWGWGRITARTSTTVVSVQVEDGTFPTAATAFWRLGVWSDTTGWPTAVTFYQGRLWFAGGVEYPQRIDGSVTGDYENFRPNDPIDETVADDDACSYTIGANDVNAILWLIDDEKGLVVGTVGGEWILRANTYGDAITPTNVKADRPTTNGSARIKPVRAGKAAVYVQRAGRKLREIAYTVDVDGFRSPDITLLAEHITRGGVNKLAYQQEPHSIIWSVRNDGVLLGLSYDRDQDVVGWHQHPLGGTNVAVESIATIPSPDGSGDDLWLLVKRTINGSLVRHVEYMTPLWEVGSFQGFRGPELVTQPLDFTKDWVVGGGGVITGTNTFITEGSTTGGVILHSVIPRNKLVEVRIQGSADAKVFVRNSGSVYGAFSVGPGAFDATVNTVLASDADSAALYLSMLTPAAATINSLSVKEFSGNHAFYVDNGLVYTGAPITNITGLDHLEGEVVSVFADGEPRPQCLVVNGAITLQTPAAQISVGLGYVSDAMTLYIEAGAGEGTAQGKTKRIHEMKVRLLDTLAIKMGPNASSVKPVEFRGLYTGDKKLNWPPGYDTLAQVYLRVDTPVPATVLALMPRLRTYE